MATWTDTREFGSVQRLAELLRMYLSCYRFRWCPKVSVVALLLLRLEMANWAALCKESSTLHKVFYIIYFFVFPETLFSSKYVFSSNTTESTSLICLSVRRRHHTIVYIKIRLWSLFWVVGCSVFCSGHLRLLNIGHKCNLVVPQTLVQMSTFFRCLFYFLQQNEKFYFCIW